MLRLAPVVFCSSSSSSNERARARRAAEKKRLESFKVIRTNLQNIIQSEKAYLADIRKKYEPIITFTDNSEVDDADETVPDTDRVPDGTSQ